MKTKRPLVFYDGSCAICRRGAARFGPTLRRRGFRMMPLQSPQGRRIVTDGSDEMKVLTADSQLLGGAEGIAYLAGFIWWAKPIAWLWRVPWMRPVFRWIYRFIADRRQCDGNCRIANQENM